MGKIASRLVSLLMLGLLGAVLIPGCVIRIGSDEGADDTPQPRGPGDESTPEEPAVTPEETTIPEEPTVTSEEAAITALENVDPDEAALKNATAEYAAVTCSSLVQSQLTDTDDVDPEAVQQLFDQYAPIAIDQALAWMSSANASILAEGIRPAPEFECIKPPHECRATEVCPIGDGAVCIVTGCADGKCPWCDLFGSLIYDGYCTYACMQGGRYWGYGFNLRLRFAKQWNGFVCRPFPQ
ncbi:hypothetical protein [Sorangium sp. So ce1153]|uniref:hypothetical protein n=1 Tax=Sorangium sp. So ce1153 TaxID=3133333 RepID=UPI003F64451C